LLRFEAFEVDLRSGELRAHGSKTHLQPQPFQLLAILLEHPGELVTREEIRQRLWPSDTFVDFEHSLNTSIRKLRQALGEDAETPRYIETLPRRGYRFIGPVEPVEAIYRLPEAESPNESTAIEVGAVRELPPKPPRGGQSPIGVDVKPRRTLPRRHLLPGVGVTVAVLLVAAYSAYRFYSKARLQVVPATIRSLAVLPLENLSHDPDQEYFADGLTDALITDLGKIATLRVISRTSVMRYKGAKKPLPEIARELGVDAVVEGTVQRSGDHVRITAQLLDARTDSHLWAEAYERDPENVIRLERQAALAIAREVSGRLTPAQQLRLAGSRATNARAYDAYLRGRYLWDQRTPEPVAEAVGYFEQALREDPHYAMAYSGLADCYSAGWWQKGDLTLAEKHARKALALDPDLAEAHTSLGIVDQYQGKFAAAENDLKRALDLNPNYAVAHHFYAFHLLSLGRLAEALAENNRALELDPFSFPANTVRQFILTGLRQYDRAAEQCEATAAMNPRLPHPHSGLARIYWVEARVPDALAEERKAATLSQAPARLHDLEQIDAAYRKSGPRAAQLQLAQLREKGYGDYLPLDIAFAYGVLEDKGKVLKWLNQSLHDRTDDFLLMLKSAPEFDCVRSDPRFRDLVRRVGLPP
jgi:TolB-like protein/DNA-binding winged helix-turn-helix (wHTH) protein/Tfp pilus assembly protein PilF